jgi:hypothetical protein
LSSGEDDDDDGEARPKVIESAKAAATASSTISGSSSESSSELVSKSDPVAVAKALGASEAKLIGGQVVGSICFKSRDREREFLAEAGSTFYFPLMEQRLMDTGVANALQCTEDLVLKSFVATYCAQRQMEVELGASLRVAELEEKLSALEKKKADLEGSLASARSQAETSTK